MRKSWSVRACTALGLILAACSGGKTVDLGGGEQPLAGEGGPVCDQSGVATGDFYVGSYDALRKLDNCREIRGNLTIGKLDVPDLTPLSELRVVDGTLHLGVFAYEASMGISPSDLVVVPGAGEAPDFVLTHPPGEVWFPSLAGLGSLETVHDLVLDSIGAVDFAELGSLRRVGGTLMIGAAPALRDLSALRAVSIGGLSLSGVPELVSLEGLPAVDQLERLIFREAPKLVDIDALTGVQEVLGELSISRTGITNLDALGVLRWALGGINIEENLELIDLEGLDGLETVTWVALHNNPKLAVMPRFSRLESIESLQIHYTALEALDLALPSLAPDGRPSYPVNFPWRLLEVANNSRLKHLTLAKKVTTLETLIVSQNDSLEQLDLGGLESANGLNIEANPALDTVVAPRLRTVDGLYVVDNPLLSLAPFAEVQTFVTEVSGNADQPAP
jgi:hypothetical protein